MSNRYSIAIGQTIPKNLDEAILCLEKSLSEKEITYLKGITEDFFINSEHHRLGREIRNNWGIWSGSELAEYFKSIGISHPDDISGIILKSFIRHIQGKDIHLKEQIEYYQKYWEIQKENDEYTYEMEVGEGKKITMEGKTWKYMQHK